MSIRALLFACLLSCLMAFPAAAVAAPGECPGEADWAQLQGLRDRVNAAESPEAARDMVRSQTRLGHEAISRARRMMPDSADIAEAEVRLIDFEAAIEASTTQAEVAGNIDALATSAGTGCDYSKGEVVIIIIGFIFGIIPGILFLFLFC